MILTNEEEKQLIDTLTWHEYWAKREKDRRDERAFWNAWDKKWKRETKDTKEKL